MRKTLTVNLGGTIYNINDDAYSLLESYLEALKAHFGRSKAGEEIVNDIEFRISEIFSEHVARGVQVIDYIHVEQVIARLGKPEEMDREIDFEEEEAGDGSTKEEKKRREEEVKRKLFRHPDDKILGGVTAGVAAYLGWDVTLLRLALILLGCFVQGVLIAYLIAWIVIPLAKTAADKLAMHGRTANLENIGKTVTDGFERVNDYVRTPQARTTWQKLGDGLVKVAGFFIKLVLILLAICCAPFLLIILALFFALLLVSLGLITATPAILLEISEFLPFFNLESVELFPGSTLVLALWGVMLVCLPLVGLIQLVMSSLNKWEPMSMATRVILILVWLFSLGGVVWFALNQPFWHLFG
ncbi:MAG: PspC domain-containing protein [Phocaeicola sp.]